MKTEYVMVDLDLIKREFPLFDDNGLDEVEHHCEWSMQHDRKRLHAMLAAAPKQEAEPVAFMAVPHYKRDTGPQAYFTADAAMAAQWAYNGYDGGNVTVTPLYAGQPPAVEAQEQPFNPDKFRDPLDKEMARRMNALKTQEQPAHLSCLIYEAMQVLGMPVETIDSDSWNSVMRQFFGEQPAPIPTRERPPTEADADPWGEIYTYLHGRWMRLQWHAITSRHTIWKPTGLTRPQNQEADA